MAAPLTKQCRGLYTATNRYDVPEGALVQATNVLISKDGVIQPRWGLPAYSTTMVTSVTFWHRMIEFGGGLWFAGSDSGTSTYKLAPGSIPFTGVSLFNNIPFLPPDGWAAYFTTATPFFDAGFTKAGRNLYINQFNGLFRKDSLTGYVQAGNFPVALSCFPRPLTQAIGTMAKAATTITVTTPFSHRYAVGITVTMTSAGEAGYSNGDKVILTVPTATTYTYFEAAGGPANNTVAQIIAPAQFVGSSGFMGNATGGDQVAYRAFLTQFDVNGTAYQGEVSDRVVVTNVAPFVGTANNKNIQLAVMLYGATVNSKLELYRSKKVNVGTVGPVFGVADDVMYLVYTKYLTEAERAAGVVWITDIQPDLLGGKPLYTNEDQEGLKQNANRPAGAKMTTVWGKRLVQANTFDYPGAEFQLLSTDSASGGLAAAQTFTLSDPSSGLRLLSVASGTGFTVARNFTVFTAGTSSTNVQNTVLSMIDTVNWNGLDPLQTALTAYQAGYLSTGTDWPGRFYFRMLGADQYEETAPENAIRIAIANLTGTGPRGAFAPKLGAQALVSGSPSCAAAVLSITTGASHNFEVGEMVTLFNGWATQTVATIGGVACQGTITAITATTLTVSVTGLPNGSTTADRVSLTYSPKLNNGWKRNRVRVSKVAQLEAFPASNYVDVGDSGSHVLAVVPCKDSLLVFKEDGLFRVTASGVFGETLSSELLDPNAVLWARETAVTIQGKVMAWLTKGVAVINEQGVEKYVSERIQDKLRPTTSQFGEPDLLSYPYSRRAIAVVDELNGTYELRVCMNFAASAPFASTVNLTYNMLNDTWVQDDLAVVAECFYQNSRFIVQGSTLYRQDPRVYAGNNGDIATVVATSTSNVYTFTYTQQPAVGTVFEGGDFALQAQVLTSGGGVGTVYCPDPQGLAPSESLWSSGYAPVTSTIEWAPFTFSEENKVKRFSEIQVMFGQRQNLVVNAVFGTEMVPTTENVTCRLPLVAAQGGISSYYPYNLRCLVPQQHRIAQQLSVSLVIRTSYGVWTILGIGASAQVVGTRVNR